MTTFGQIADVYGGSTPKTSVAEYWGGEITWAVPRDLTALYAPYLFDTERHITAAGLASIGNRLYPAAANQGFVVVVHRQEDHRWFLFHEMRSRVDDMLDLANGSTFLEISRGNFKSMTTVRPLPSELAKLDSVLSPLHEWCASVVQESARLTQMRNELLPRLVSGEIRVREAEHLVGETV